MRYPSVSPLHDDAASAVAACLNGALCDQAALYAALKTAHWNVKGRGANALHKLFDELASNAAERADKLAERVVHLGYLAQASPHLIAATSPVASYPLTIVAGPEHVTALLDKYRLLGSRLRDAIGVARQNGDSITAQMLEALTEATEHDAMFLASEAFAA